MSFSALIDCGFDVAELSFMAGDRELWFASRLPSDDAIKRHWFLIDLDSDRVQRCSKNEAEPTTWTIAETIAEFSSTEETVEPSWIERVRLSGFAKLQPSTPHEQFQNYFGSRGDGSKWLVLPMSKSLVRFDVHPVQTFVLDGIALVPKDPGAAERPELAAQPKPISQRVPTGPVVHSGRNVQPSMFDCEPYQ